MNDIRIDAEKQQTAREYAGIRRRLMLLGLVFGSVYLLAWIGLGWDKALRNWLEAQVSAQWLVVALFAIAFAGLHILLTLPMDYYSGFVLPHRYEMSNQSIGEWLGDQLKGMALSAVLGLLLLEIVYWVLGRYPAYWWLIVGIIMLLFTVILAQLAPVFLMPLFYKFVPLDAEYDELVTRLTKLFEQAGTTVEGVYKFDMSSKTNAANAALTGLGKTRRIILGDTLLEKFSADEIETVLAHELGHHVNKDIPILIASQSLLTLGGLFLASLGLRWGVVTIGYNGISDIATLPLFTFVMSLYGLLTMPLGNILSRSRERMADKFALDSTNNTEAFASAMKRLANQNLADVDPPKWVETLLHSHPSLKSRIAFAEGYRSRQTR